VSAEEALVQGLSDIMREKLRENRHKGHWAGSAPYWLITRLREEVVELEREFMLGAANPEELDIYAIGRECADIACFAAMVADVVGELKRRRESAAKGTK
jgi:hypothetical protein